MSDSIREECWNDAYKNEVQTFIYEREYIPEMDEFIDWFLEKWTPDFILED